MFLTDSLSDLDGVGRYAVCLLKALQARDPELEVQVLLARKHRPTSESVPPSWPVEVVLPPDYFFYMSPLRFWVSLVQSTWRTWRVARRADLVHAIKDYPHNLVGLLGARLAGVPCVATAHGTYTVQPVLDQRHRRLAAWAYRRFDGMITVSAYTARRLADVLETTGIELPRMRTIPNCVEVEPLEAEQHLGARPWHGLRFTLGVGETKERKGHHLALAAWVQVAADHPDLHHFIVGRLSEDDYEQRLRSIAAEAGMADRVHFLGNITEAEKIDLQQRCEVFVHTPVTASDGGFEGFGIVYLEASACGKPVIGTLECGAEDAIVDRVTGYLCEPEVESVRDALERLIADPVLGARLGAQGRAHARSNTWARNADAVLALYREILKVGR
ncbi:glycosyltransferase family 4 protein [Engelhardtia mirabilis]|uniref:glycosyltransferase family 4 protein n=1 Tax=Engelhardtia mirabilis TaxID=2528011 RepID=UPI003AF40585